MVESEETRIAILADRICEAFPHPENEKEKVISAMIDHGSLHLLAVRCLGRWKGQKDPYVHFSTEKTVKLLIERLTTAAAMKQDFEADRIKHCLEILYKGGRGAAQIQNLKGKTLRKHQDGYYPDEHCMSRKIHDDQPGYEFNLQI